MKLATIASAILATSLLYSGSAAAQACPEKNINYWQAFPAGGESDISARHQQLVLKKRCPGIETIVQYKPGAGGGSQQLSRDFGKVSERLGDTVTAC